MLVSRRLYRLQSRLALTAPEAVALLVLSGALALGLGVRQLQERAAPPAAALAAADARWAALDAAADSAASGAVGEPAFTSRLLPVDSVAIPASGFADTPARSRRSSANSPVRMNLNTADAALLQRLPRIGPALAGRIIAYRQERGPFRRVEDIVNVRGIGPKTLEQIQPYLYVE
jgi:competence ComEA-like helix-hairpin-helix protein